MYVGSYALQQSANIKGPFYSDSEYMNLADYSNIQPNSLIHVCPQALPKFLHHVFPTIIVPFKLITNNSDSTVNEDYPNETNTLLNSPYLTHWFAQNCTLDHPKITRIPIGLDYHSMIPSAKKLVWLVNTIQYHKWGMKKNPYHQEQDLIAISSSAQPFHRRITKIYANFQFLMTTRYGKIDRTEAYNTIPRYLIDYENKHQIRNECWKRMTSYAFVASPHGNGLDCHRTWEALCLGCIPIVKSSGLDSLFTDLPVWIVKDWSEVTLDNMKATITNFKTKSFNYEKLTLQYWKNLIQSK